jgi:hypothetical protein
VITILVTTVISLHEIDLEVRSRQEDNIEIIFKKWDGKAWTGLISLRTWAGGERL